METFRDDGENTFLSDQLGDEKQEAAKNRQILFYEQHKKGGIIQMRERTFINCCTLVSFFYPLNALEVCVTNDDLDKMNMDIFNTWLTLNEVKQGEREDMMIIFFCVI